jgi:hypothetical protein
MAEAWPDDLPQCLLPDTVAWQIGDGRLRTPMDAGPGKSRARTSAVSDQLSGQLLLTAAQRATLTTFVKVTLLGGTGTFTFRDPDGGSGDLLVRFADALPEMSRAGRGHWLATLQLEVLP